MNKLLFLSVIIDCVNIECHNWSSFCENDECVVCSVCVCEIGHTHSFPYIAVWSCIA